MKVAIIGGGISGLMVAEKLEGKCDYTLFEKASRAGGHTDTHEVTVDNKTYNVDTGFIVCNRKNYPTFFSMLDKYGIETQKSDMSFSVNNMQTGLVYNATNLSSLFCQKRNLLNPRFYRMIKDILRFYNESESVLESQTKLSLGEYLKQNNYSKYFLEEHILPMASALWSGDFESIMEFPVTYLLSFMKNHQMLQISDRPLWETIKGGSQQYVKTLIQNLSGTFVTNCQIESVTRTKDSVKIHASGTSYEFDKVFFATHSDQTLALLGNQTSKEETEILGSIPYVNNVIDLHTDSAIMPENKKAWASWTVNKYPVDTVNLQQCTVNYYMNLLQNIDCPQPLIVSLNQSQYINSEKILKSVHYQHPVYTSKTIESQQRKNEIQGKHNSYFCGAYWGWGFHEDGARSAHEAVQQFMKECM